MLKIKCATACGLTCCSYRPPSFEAHMDGHQMTSRNPRTARMSCCSTVQVTQEGACLTVRPPFVWCCQSVQCFCTVTFLVKGIWRRFVLQWRQDFCRVAQTGWSFIPCSGERQALMAWKSNKAQTSHPIQSHILWSDKHHLKVLVGHPESFASGELHISELKTGLQIKSIP